MMSHDPSVSKRVIYTGHTNDEESLRIAFMAQHLPLKQIPLKDPRFAEARQAVEECRTILKKVRDRLPLEPHLMPNGKKREVPAAQPLIFDEDALTVGNPDATNPPRSVIYVCRMVLRALSESGPSQYGMLVDERFERFQNPACIGFRVSMEIGETGNAALQLPILTPGAFQEAVQHARERNPTETLLGWLFETKVRETTEDRDTHLIAMEEIGDKRYCGTFSRGETYTGDLRCDPITLVPQFELRLN